MKHAVTSRPGTPDSGGKLGFRTLRILIADDSRIERRVVASILQRRGHHVTAATDGQEALALFESGLFDAAVLDLQMPGFGGAAVATAIREREQAQENGRLRVIALSGSAPDDAGDGAIDRYLLKPVDPDLLTAALEGAEDGALPQEPEESDLGERVVFDLGEALARVRGKRALLAELVRIFLEDASVQMLALRAALDASDLDRIERASHRLKGSAMNVSAQLTAEVARQIEQRARNREAAAADVLWTRLEEEVARARRAFSGFLVQNTDSLSAS